MTTRILAMLTAVGSIAAQAACRAQPTRSSLSPFDGAITTSLASPRVSVPLIREGEFYFANVSINGRPFKFTLETGASFVGISSRAATSLGLRVDSIDLSATAGPQATRTPVARIDSLAIGGVTYKGLAARVSPMWDNAGFDGIITLPLFKELLATLDLSHSQLILEKGSLPSPNGRDVIAFAGVDRAERVDLPMSFGSLTLPVVIDTRAFIPVALPDSLQSRLSFKSPPISIGQAAGPSLGSFEMRGARLAGNSRIADVVFRDVPITLRTRGGAIVGVPLLEHLLITLDMANKRARVVQSGTQPIELQKMSWETASPGEARAASANSAPPASGGQRSMGFNMAGYPGSSDLRLLNIIPGSDAEKAGLKNDDVLVEFDGVAAGDMNPGVFRAAIARGTPAKVVVTRDGKRLEFIVKPYTPQ